MLKQILLIAGVCLATMAVVSRIDALDKIINDV